MNVRFALAFAVLLFVGASHASAQTYSQAKFWKFSSNRSEILQTGNAAGGPNPVCGVAPDHIKAVDVLAHLGAQAVDAYLASFGNPTVFGYGITSGLLDLVANDGNRQWLRTTLGLNNGLSNCATQILVVPKDKDAGLSIFGCLSETGGDGLDCGANGWSEGNFMGAYNLSRAETEKSVVYVMTGKSWSHNRNRWFWIVATDVNPLNGAPLLRLYRATE